MGTISVTVHEQAGNTPLPCRAWVQVGNKQYNKPITKSCTPYDRESTFSCDGNFVIKVPAGKAIVHLERGKEYRPVNKKVVVKENQTTEVEISLERWVNMAKEGWFSADFHCHFGSNDLGVLKQLALADDINLLPSFTYWNDFKKNWPQSKDAGWPVVKVDDTHLVTLANVEIERIAARDAERFLSVGAPFFFGLKKPIYVSRHDDTYPCNTALQQLAKKASPTCIIDTDKPLWAENVVGVALGLFDCVQICHNHYHRKGNLQLGWGMIGPVVDEERKDWGEEELFWRTNDIYYRWLNCGFKLAASGGSAMGVMPSPMGFSRTYAKLDGPLTEANYLKAVRAGRTFATSGPMLILTANGQDVGSTVSHSWFSSRSVSVKVELRSIQPIESLELIENGKVIEKVDLSGRKPTPVLTEIIEVETLPFRSGWIAARALFKGPKGRLRQAHTSPIYIVANNNPTASKRDAEYMIRWIDRIYKITERPDRYKSEQDRAEVQAIYRKAKQVYQDIADTAVKVWKD